MSSCERWTAWIDAESGASAEERRRHLKACDECREQWDGHQALTRLSEMPIPALSCDLGPVIGRAVAGTEADSLLSPRQRRAMRIYWLLATFAAGVVLAQQGGAVDAWLAFWVFLGSLLVAALPALLLLRRRLAWDLLDLVVWTVR